MSGPAREAVDADQLSQPLDALNDHNLAGVWTVEVAARLYGGGSE